MNYIMNIQTKLKILSEQNNYLNYLEQELFIIINHGYNLSKISEAQSNFFETQKNKIEKVINSIDEIWKSYIENMKELSKRIPEIKGSIKNIKDSDKKITSTYEIYPYWKNLSYLFKNDLPKFSLSNPKLMDSLSSAEDLEIKYLNKYLKNGEDISQSYLQFVRGTQKNTFTYDEIVTQLNDIVDYFNTFNNTIQNLTSQYQVILSSYETFENSVLKRVNVTEGNLYVFNENKLFSELDKVDYQTLRESIHILCEEINDPRTHDKQDFQVGDTITNKDAKILVDKFIIYIKEYYKILAVKMKLSEEIFLAFEDLIKNIEKEI